uniref:WGS project CBMI000000000 data, contig CS3069_c000371 n=1 Tax=Fusarium clavum TaxID=2594811 RepID=A0A090N591_9HYPO|nr:unnamed protein product [Fusarium clavum]
MQGCWQRGTDKDQASEDQDQNQGTHAPDQQRQLQIPHFGVGFGQSEIQASVTDSPRQEPADSLTAQQPVGEKPSSIDEILAQSPPGLEQPGDPSLYYLGLLQNQNQLHHEHHRAQQYQGFPAPASPTSRMLFATTTLFFPLSLTSGISTSNICLRTGSSSSAASSCNSTKTTPETTLPTNDVSPSAESVPLPVQFQPELKLKQQC